uniref:Uncharacterized protein n=1 Tax=Aegilops tauschii subsp. strangulata TaxID=200361 RepID=A0A452ZW39_AEGTS
MLQRRQMERLPALHLAVVSLLGFCCLIHASRAAISFPPAAPRVQLQETDAILASSGADGQGGRSGGTRPRRCQQEDGDADGGGGLPGLRGQRPPLAVAAAREEELRTWSKAACAFLVLHGCVCT